jgi:hypothetical protein
MASLILPPAGPAGPSSPARAGGGPVLLESQLRRFVAAWETVAGRPEDLLVDDHLGFVLPLLARVLDGWLGRRAGKPTTFDPASTAVGVKGILVRRIRESAGVSDPAWDVLRAAHGNDVADLIAACKTTPVDARLISGILQRGLATPRFKVDAIVEALLVELTTRPPPVPIPVYSPVAGNTPAVLAPVAVANLRLPGLTTLLARAYALDDDPRGLAGTPERALNGTAIGQALGPHVGPLAADTVRLEAVWAMIRRMAGIAVASDHATLLAVGQPDGIIYGEVFVLANAVDEVLWDESHYVPPATAVGNSGLNERLGRATIRAWTHRLIDGAVGLLGPPIVMQRAPPQSRDYTSALEEAVTSLLEPWFRSLPAGTNQPQAGGRLPIVLVRGLEASVRRAIVSRTLDRLLAGLSVSEAHDLGRAMLSNLAGLPEAAEMNWRTASRGDARRVIRQWASRTEEHRRLAKLVDAARGDVATSLRTVFEEIASPGSAAWWAPDAAGFWSQWVKDVIAATDTWTSAWREIAWDRLTPAAVTELRDRLGGTYASRTYDVVFAVDGADAQGEMWTGGGITWFAAGALTLGEQWPGAGPQTGTKSSAQRADASDVVTPTPMATAARDTLYAWLTVDAPSAFAAQRDARAWLEAALSALTFAYSVNEQVRGFRPRVRRLALRGVVATGYSSLTSESKREELFHLVPVRDERLVDFTRVYGELIARASNEANQTDLERRLMRAFAWYRAGRWDPTPVTRFLSYFVALEHLFVGGRIGVKGALAEEASPLMVTWVQAVNRAELDRIKPELARASVLREAALQDPAMASALDGLAQFRGWRMDLRPFVVPDALAAAEAALPTASPAGAQFTAHKSALQAFAAIWATRALRRVRERERWQVVLSVLANRRHDIVHEAVVTGPDMELYARRLERIVQRILDRLTDVAINAAATVGTVEGAVRWHEDPWL